MIMSKSTSSRLRPVVFWLIILLHGFTVSRQEEQQQQQQQQQRPKATPPLPLLPLPSYSQLEWQQRELIMILDFGLKTFTENWPTGREDPAIFNPTDLNAVQWVDAAAGAGISLMMLTAKQDDGFCLWPSEYTNYSVIGSPWRNGRGDVVREFVNAAKAQGVDRGLYLSPIDNHDERYGHAKEYNEYFVAQLQELLSRYGNVREIWLFGAEAATYYYKDWFAMAKGLQRSINIFSDASADLRWPVGLAGTTCWSTINRTSIISFANLTYLHTGDPKGTDWVPPECPVEIRIEGLSESPMNLSQLLDIYYKSVGRNCVLNLIVPPNTTGLISESDVRRLREFRIAIDTIFSTNLAEGCLIEASSQRGGKGSDFGPENVVDSDHLWTYWVPSDDDKEDHWIEFNASRGALTFNVVRIQEAIGLGQRIQRHEIYADCKKIADGTTVGYKRLHRLEKRIVHARSVRIKFTGSRAIPLISSIGLYFDPFWFSGKLYSKSNTAAATAAIRSYSKHVLPTS